MGNLIGKCAGLCLGEDDEFICPLRENCKKFNEDIKSLNEQEELMFFTYAFGCEDYEPINEDIE